MPSTVYANGGGLFHKGSNGTAIAFPDVCLSPPPPPAGPVPIPYPNTVLASDLADGSKTVKIQGQPTALKDSSNISTSTGDEAGTQGGNVVTHKTKGKGYFQLWSFDVKIEGKNVDRDGDPLGQNSASPPPGACAMRALVVRTAVALAEKPPKKCPRKYKKSDRYGTPTTAQTNSVQGGPCWQCKTTKGPFIADHQPPCGVIFYAGGCHPGAKPSQEAAVKNPKNVKPHCPGCSASQGGLLSHYGRQLAGIHGL